MQAVTIGKDGAISGLQVKPGKGFDFRKLGLARIVRASEILFNEVEQAWTICVLDRVVCSYISGDASPAPVVLHRSDYHRFLDKAAHGALEGRGDSLCFDSYEDAVKAEIAFLDCLRLRGVHDPA